MGGPSSRKIAQATHEQVPLRVLGANQHPDHDTICTFRRRHLAALAELSVQVLQLCQKARLVKLGHVAVAGTKVQANALQAQASQEQVKEDAEGDDRPEATGADLRPEPDNRGQRNFTDPDSRIMGDNSTKSFQQCYNCQAAVDDQAQVLVAADVAQQANDKAQVELRAEQLQDNTDGDAQERILLRVAAIPQVVPERPQRVQPPGNAAGL